MFWISKTAAGYRWMKFKLTFNELDVQKGNRTCDSIPPCLQDFGNSYDSQEADPALFSHPSAHLYYNLVLVKTEVKHEIRQNNFISIS